MSKPLQDLESELTARQHPGGGFPYRRGGMSFTDATAWAMVAVPASRPKALAYLTACQRGPAFAVTEADPEPSWMTIPATLALSVAGEPRASAASRWLVDDFNAQSEPGKRAPGWPWSNGCAPWVEPTTLALIALAHAGLAEHARVREGLAMVISNQAKGGGWSLYARRPHVYHTGLVLTALRALRASVTTPSKFPEPSKEDLDKAHVFLLQAAPDSRALLDVAVAALALSGTKSPAAEAVDAALARRLEGPPEKLDTLGAALALIALKQKRGEQVLRLEAVR